METGTRRGRERGGAWKARLSCAGRRRRTLSSLLAWLLVALSLISSSLPIEEVGEEEGLNVTGNEEGCRVEGERVGMDDVGSIDGDSVGLLVAGIKEGLSNVGIKVTGDELGENVGQSVILVGVSVFN